MIRAHSDSAPANPERFLGGKRNGVSDAFARRGENEARAHDERTTKLLRNKAQPARPIQQKSLRLRLIEGSSGLRLGRPGTLRKGSPKCLQSHGGAGGVLGGILELDMVGTGRF